MPSKNELKESILPIWKVVTLAKKCFRYAFYLHKPDTEIELEFLERSREFTFIRHILWRNTVIELSKLFSSSPKRDKYNIFHFINKLKKDQYFGTFEIDPSKIKTWEEQLEMNSSTINIILELRDKVYAHTDNEKAKSNLDTPTFEQTEKLLNIVEGVIQEIYATVFDGYAEMESPTVKETPEKIIKILAKEKKNRIDAIHKGLKSKTTK
ncbi:hypothetical protein [Flagellimonas nanhaiensis]|uniref:HEPN AbiU2-like domain-containing protein n=1 Tax=Flagellimonas nanhaiensis TaxID=2292706 RepID=A0A371JML1_9FLAO|nr:hypothetical protein [Allomuricauda nanhaiensis]RDY58382.1 hypothetical protein DX873_15370 [Allomuricauda nanhaiensis]